MAFFKFRKPTSDAPQPKAQVQSIEIVRQRAKFRLVGAMVLILLGVVALPLLFDKQPRPIAVDTPIDIPDKNKVLPLVIPPVPEPSPSPPVSLNKLQPQPTSAPNVTVAASSPVVRPTTEPKDIASPARALPAAPIPVPLVKPSITASATPPVVVNRAQALLDGQDVAMPASKRDPADASSQRVVVQVGAFADAARAQEVRWKIEKAGLKTYTQVADTKDGKRIRVRVGPFATRAEAENAAARIKKLDLPTVLLTL